MRKTRVESLAICLALAAFVPRTVAQGTYTQIDVPAPWHASATVLSGINSAGDIVGYYEDAEGGFHGFLLSAGTFTHIDRGSSTFLFGINDQGRLVGEAGSEGFLYDRQNQTFTLLNYPGSRMTSAHAINNSGVIVGLAQDQQFRYFGWELISAARFLKIRPQHSEFTVLTGINNAAVIALISTLHSGLMKSYLLQNGEFLQFRLPEVMSTSAEGINDNNEVVGCYQDANNSLAGFLRRPAEQFVPLNFPGSQTTCALAINGAGTVAGYFTTEENRTHGFVWTPTWRHKP